jgi:Leucine-rich repeat (LRR) protein
VCSNLFFLVFYDCANLGVLKRVFFNQTMDAKQVTVKLGSDTKQTKPTNTKKNNKTQPSVDLNKEFIKAKDEAITTLNFCKSNITTVPPNIGQLVNLVELFLYGNKIAVLPSEIGNLTQLQVLALNENQVSHGGWALQLRKSSN